MFNQNLRRPFRCQSDRRHSGSLSLRFTRDLGNVRLRLTPTKAWFDKKEGGISPAFPKIDQSGAFAFNTTN